MNTIYWHMNATRGGANLHPGANCAHEHGFSLRKNMKAVYATLREVQNDVIASYVTSM